MNDGYSLSPEVEDLFNRAYQLHVAGDLQGAATLYRKCTDLEPLLDLAWGNLGRCLADLHCHVDALAAYKKAIERAPFNPEFHLREGLSLRALGRHTEARVAFVFASKLDTQYADPLLALSATLEEAGELIQAAECLEKALPLLTAQDPEAVPRKVAVLENYAVILLNLHKPLEAAQVWEQIRALQPNNANAMLHLAACHLDALSPDTAHALFDTASGMQLTSSQQSAVLMSLLYRDSYPPRDILARHKEWGARLQGGSTFIAQGKSNHHTASRPLRVGYLSSDFKSHAVSQFIFPIITNHSERVEIFLYANVDKPDSITATYQSRAHHFRLVNSLSDLDLAEAIRGDRLDILIELNGHTLGNRLAALALKPAPVICSWIGYPTTTGLSAIDYRFVDIYTDPPGSEQLHSETLVRLPLGFNCFQPIGELPAIAPLPALTRGHITFGSANNIRKITPRCLALWGEILRNIPSARLALKWSAFAHPTVRARTLELLRPFGVAEDRIEWCGYIPGQGAHLEFYNSIDIALDTFPYNGTTTTCDALSMGVPIITMYGTTHISRVSLSILTRIGRPEFAAADSDQYVSQAIALAGDIQNLSKVRASLRPALQNSALCSYKAFVNSFEETLIALSRPDALRGS